MIGATRAARIEFGLGDAPSLEPRPAADVLSGTPAQSDLAAAERAELRRAILRANGNMSEAARALGVGRLEDERARGELPAERVPRRAARAADVEQEATAIFITAGEGTEHRPR